MLSRSFREAGLRSRRRSMRWNALMMVVWSLPKMRPISG